MLYRAVVAVAVLCLSGASAFTLAPAGALTVNTASAARVEEITMGRGDKRTAKGKRKAKSHGVYRPKNSELRKRKAAFNAASEE